MRFLKWLLGRGKKTVKLVVKEFDPEEIADAKIIVNILKYSPFYSSMEAAVLRQKFSMQVGVQGDKVNARIVKALQFLKTYGVIQWGGPGAGVTFDKKRLVMPVILTEVEE